MSTLLQNAMGLYGGMVIPKMDEFFFDTNGNFITHTYDEVMGKFSKNDIRMYMHFKALYTIPTIELVDFIKKESEGLRSLEIGAGAGLYVQATGIAGVDSFLQERPDIREHYKTINQPTIVYGNNVERLDANSAIDKYKPEFVYGSYITPKGTYEQSLQGFCTQPEGPDEEHIINNVRTYMKIGDMSIHTRSVANIKHLDKLQVITNVPVLARCIINPNTTPVIFVIRN